MNLRWQEMEQVHFQGCTYDSLTTYKSHTGIIHRWLAGHFYMDHFLSHSETLVGSQTVAERLVRSSKVTGWLQENVW
jgi:hypothetical protein